MFLAEVTAVQADEAYLNEKGKFELNKTGLLAYSHGEYLGLGKEDRYLWIQCAKEGGPETKERGNK